MLTDHTSYISKDLVLKSLKFYTHLKSKNEKIL